MIKLILFLFGCYPLCFLNAQTNDIAKIISGTYRCSSTHIGTFEKLDVDKDRGTVRIRKTGENKVSVSMDGATSSYELTIEIGGPQSIVGEATIKGMRASLSLELDKKPAAIRGGNANEAATKENTEVWWFEGTATEEKPESLTASEEKEEVNNEKLDSSNKYKDQYGRNWNGPFPFNYNSIQINAPKDIGIYQILKKNGADYNVMYIGIGTGSEKAKGERSTINTRLRKHFIGNGNKNIAALGNPSELWFIYWVCDNETAKQIESNVITDNKPPFNMKLEYKNYIENIYVH